jgi:phospholipase C
MDFRSLFVIGASLAATAPVRAAEIGNIETVVVIYAENRSFDNVFGVFPGARGLAGLSPQDYAQIDRNGELLKELPRIWLGLGGKYSKTTIPEDQTKGLTNAPFAIDDPNGLNFPANLATRDLVHKFYEEQMQIDGGKNDRFVAYGDAGALQMGHYAHANPHIWDIAKKYALADNFFHGAFGGSFLNHFSLICACIPYYQNADTSPAKALISKVEADGVTLVMAEDSPASTMNGPPKFARSGSLTPDFFAVNTMQPPYQPSAIPPAPGQDPAYADPANAVTLPPQHEVTIGDLLTAKGVDWAWYAAGWSAVLDGGNAKPVPNFQFHHQPFNYFAQFAPGTTARADHLRDGGLAGQAFLADIDAGKLPSVTFYKPEGDLNEHPDYSSVSDGDAHVADVVAHLERSPQWGHMLVIVTYDENGGFWDHVAPPKADRWGPGSRIPAIIVSPLARKGYIDHTQYDTTSILRFITRRWNLPVLPGLIHRDKALAAQDQPPMGDLTGAIDPSITPQ